MLKRSVLRLVPFYVARVACNFNPDVVDRVMFLNRRRMIEAIKLAGLMLRVFVENCRACPFCGMPFKGKQGLYNHLWRKHYGDLMELVHRLQAQQLPEPPAPLW